MAPAKLKNLAICFSGTFGNAEAQLKKWTEANDGTYHRQIKSDTTHLIVSKANWRARVPEVKVALKDKSIKIVDYEWFDDKLRLGGRITENKYLWTTLDEERIKQQSKEERAAGREKKRLEKEKERKKKDSERIDWGGALLQHTNVVARVEDSEDREDSEDSAGREVQEEFARGAKQAKADLLSDNHHIYVDQTGFSMDITLTKASVELSRIDRARITIYETNNVPYSYSVVAKIPEPDPTDLAIITGTNYATAFRTFKRDFEKLAGFEWNNRIEKSVDRPTLAPLPRPKYDFIIAGKGSPPGKLPKKGKEKENEAESEVPTAEQLQQRLEEAFTKQKYRYRLPNAGAPRGTMSDGSHYKHQDKKTAYDLFGKAADRSEEAVKIKEEAKEEAKRLLKNLKKRQGPVEIVVIDSDDDEEDDEGGDDDDDDEGGDDDEEEDEERDEDEKMEEAAGYVAAKSIPVNVQQMAGSFDGGPGAQTDSGADEDFTMIDAPGTQL